MDTPVTLAFYIFLISILWIGFSFLTRSRKSGSSSSRRLPPGPFPFPIIGNILSLGSSPHRSLSVLSRKYGPLMLLKLGSRTAIVVSSPDTAKLLFQKYDQSISSRTVPAALEQPFHLHNDSVVWLPVGNQWRKLRKICKEQMFSAVKLEMGRGLRQDKVRKLHAYVRECCRMGVAVDIGNAAFTTSLNLISTTLFSTELASFDSGTAHETKDMVWGVLKTIGTPNVADYFPTLKYVDPQGISKETKFHFDRLYEIFDGIIDTKMKSGLQNINDLTDVLLDINRTNDQDLTRNEINRLLLDLFVAGTDTTSATVEWAMAELMRNPEKMSSARAEIRDIIGEDEVIQESDIERLPYLQAVVKETLRLHPPAPLLVPHKAVTDEIEIDGHYVIPKDSQILVNVWAIGRDSNVWPEAESFMPERFLHTGGHNNNNNNTNVETDFRGRHFELIPFGTGRRICPGLPLAHRMLHLMLATFIHGFRWKLLLQHGNGIHPTHIDMSENFGLTLQKAQPLKAIPISY